MIKGLDKLRHQLNQAQAAPSAIAGWTRSKGRPEAELDRAAQK